MGSTSQVDELALKRKITHPLKMQKRRDELDVSNRKFAATELES